jgi:hypothetical protein
MRRLHLRLPAVIGLLAVIATALAGPADARVVERGVIDESFSESGEDFCDIPGLDVTFEGTVHVAYTWKTHGVDQLQYYAEHAEFRNRITNVANQKFVTTYERTMSKDLKIVDLGGGLLDIVWFGTGNATIYGSSGKAIARNPGQVRFHTVIDLHDPADDEDDEVLSGEVILGSTGRSDDFCAAVVPALS